MTTDADAKSRQISEAAEAYTASAWSASWPILTLTVSLGAWLGMLSAIALAVIRAARQGALPHITGGLIVVGLLLLEVVGAVGMIVISRRWYARWRAANTEVVPATSQERYPWLRGAAGVAVLPLWFLLFGPLFKTASISL